MDLRIEFENAMSDWIAVDGHPTWCEQSKVYNELKWQMAWAAFQKAMQLIAKNN